MLMILSLLCCATSPACAASSASASSASGAGGSGVEHSDSIGLDQIGPQSHLAAMGDFDSDKHTDLFVLNSSNATASAAGAAGTWVVEVWRWDVAGNRFTMLDGPAASIRSARQITNIVPGDFNYDGRLDLLISGPMRDSWNRPVQWISIHMGALNRFESGPGSVVSVPPAREQVLVADLNNDLMLDLFGSRWAITAPEIATGTPSAADKAKSERAYWIGQVSLDGRHTLSFDVQRQPLDQSASLQPLADLRSPHSHATVDLNGDCMADLIVSSTGLESGVQRSYIEIWLNHATRGPVLHSVSILPVGAGQAAFADVDNDGNIDVILPVFSSSSSAETNTIHIYHNQARPLCGSAFDDAATFPSSTAEAPGSTSGCRSKTALCEPDPEFYFDFFAFTAADSTPPANSANTVVYHFPTTSGSGSNSVGGQMFSAYNPTLGIFNPLSAPPFALRLGDINLDGYPDLLLSLTPSGGESNYGVVELWTNIACSAASTDVTAPSAFESYTACSPAARARGRRAFSSAGLDAANNHLASYPGAQAGGAFFDVADNGQMDILFTSVQPAGLSVAPGSAIDLPPAGTHRTHVFLNAFNEDAYFLTALASNGRCPSRCSPSAMDPDAEANPSPKPYGVNLPGGCFRLVYTDLSGMLHTSVAGGLSQSSFLSYQNPSVTFGLGRTNTFIDGFAFGVGVNTSSVVDRSKFFPAAGADDDEAEMGLTEGEREAAYDAALNAASAHSHSWVSLIPNSQLILFPYPPLSPDLWELELFVSPSSQLIWVVVAWASLLTILAMVIGYLHLQEKREDEQEKRKHQLLFTF